MTKTQKAFKIVGIIMACLICITCIGIDVWWIYIAKYGAVKLEDNVVYADQLEATDGTKANIFEVQYYSNANKNGLEMLEIKMSGLTDTEASAIYSQGLQYVADDSESSIRWNYVGENFTARTLSDSAINVKEGKHSEFDDLMYSVLLNLSDKSGEKYDYKKFNIFSGQEHQAFFQHMDTLSGVTKYNYASSDDFEKDVGLAVNPVNENTMFRIQLSEKDDEGNITKKPYAFTFRGTRSVAEIKNADEKPMYQMTGGSRYDFMHRISIITDFFPVYDVDFLAWRLFEKVKTMPAGSNQFTLVELGDWINYYSVDENSTLVADRLSVDKTNKVKTLFTSYYGIKITVHADGAMRASDSMFKTIHGSSTFNIAPEGVTNGEYFYGRDVVTVGLNAFDRVDTEEGCLLKLKDAFLAQYIDHKKLIVLKIMIDKDILKDENREFMGFVENSGLENFTIQNIYTYETIGGVIVKSEVTNAYTII